MNHILRIIGIAAQHKWWLVGAYTSMVGAMVAYIMLPQYFGEAIDDISMVLETGEYDQGAIVNIVLIILGLSVLRGVLSFFQTYMETRSTTTSSIRVSDSTTATTLETSCPEP